METLNNTARIPHILGSKLQMASGRTVDIFAEEEDKFVFYGNDIVLERSRPITTYNTILFLQIINFYQQFVEKRELIDNEDYKFSFTNDDRNKHIKDVKESCLHGENKDLFLTLGKDEKLNYIDKLIQEKKDNELLEETNNKMYLNTDKNIKINIDTGMLLRSRGTRSSLNTRTYIFNSLRELQSTTMTWYILPDSLKKEFVKIKSNKSYGEYKEELTKFFMRNKGKCKIQVRNLIERTNAEDDLKKMDIQINKGFLDLADKSKFFNYSKMNNLKSNSAKMFYFFLTFNYKEKMTKDYLYDILDLNYSKASRNLEKAKEVINELIEKEVLTKTSCYDTKTKMFSIYLTPEEKKKMGYESRIKYSKRRGTRK